MSSVFSGIFGGGAAAKPKPAVVAPTPDDDLVKRARARSLAQQQGRSGRSSTILGDFGNNSTLGP